MKINEKAEYIDNFLTKQECAEMIAKVEAIGFEDAYIISNGKPVLAKEIRNNQRVIIDDMALAENLWERLKPMLNISVEGWNPVGLNERFRYYRYTELQLFRMHRDFAYKFKSRESKWSLIIYLNEEFEGGDTEFKEFVIRPNTGRAAIFEHSLLHEGATVKSGVKYAVRTDIMFEKKA